MAWGRLLGFYGTVVPECFLREGSEGDFDDIALVGGDIHLQPAGVGAGEIPQGGEKQAYLLRRDAAIWGMLADGGGDDAGGNPAVKQAAGQPQPELFSLVRTMIFMGYSTNTSTVSPSALSTSTSLPITPCSTSLKSARYRCFSWPPQRRFRSPAASAFPFAVPPAPASWAD